MQWEKESNLSHASEVPETTINDYILVYYLNINNPAQKESQFLILWMEAQEKLSNLPIGHIVSI